MGFGKDGKGVIIRQFDAFTLSTLGSQTVIKQGNPLVIGEDFRMLKFEIFADIFGATFVDADGPLLLGIADNELSVTEIKECLEANGPLDRNDRVSMEHATRPVWPYFQISNDSSANAHIENSNQMPQEGSPRWTFSNPEGWTWWAYNMGTGALTDAGFIRIEVKYYGVWVT